MILTIDPHSGVPAYRQLMDQVRFHVASGLMRPGDELPSTRQLSVDLNLNPMTISKAYMLLEAEGVVERRRGQPLVIKAQGDAESASRRASQLRAALQPAVTAARQLGFTRDEAIKAFGDMIDEAGNASGPDSTLS